MSFCNLFIGRPSYIKMLY